MANHTYTCRHAYMQKCTYTYIYTQTAFFYLGTGYSSLGSLQTCAKYSQSRRAHRIFTQYDAFMYACFHAYM